MKLIYLLVALFLLPGIMFAKNIKEELSVEEFYQIYNKKKNSPSFIVLDVRTKEEYLAGHIEKAVLLDVSSEDFEKKISRLNKDKTYLIYCRTARRSKIALGLMKKNGFKNVSHMLGGIVVWVEKKYPVVK